MNPPSDQAVISPGGDGTSSAFVRSTASSRSRGKGRGGRRGSRSRVWNAIDSLVESHPFHLTGIGGPHSSPIGPPPEGSPPRSLLSGVGPSAGPPCVPRSADQLSADEEQSITDNFVEMIVNSLALNMEEFSETGRYARVSHRLLARENMRLIYELADVSRQLVNSKNSLVNFLVAAEFLHTEVNRLREEIKDLREEIRFMTANPSSGPPL